MTLNRTQLPIRALEQIDDVCHAFEQQWQNGTPAEIESLVPSDWSAEARHLLIAELLVLEIDYQRKGGQEPNWDEYAGRFPDHESILRDARQVATSPARRFQPPSPAEIGKHFPGLEIISLLGAGGMGAVYKAKQTGLDRTVALKILPQELGQDMRFALRFTREARILAKLNHPNIVAVHEFGVVDTMYYFFMEYVDGTNLREVVQNKRLAPEQALAIVPHLCDALQFAHDQGIVHRDIKPENILIGKDGSVKIADFGLSRVVQNESFETGLTQAHQILGTPRYMAPEQFEMSRKVDHRADIYSLGVVFYEMLTGEVPTGRFEPPSHKVSIDVRLDEIVMRTMERQPDRRYQAASDVKSDVASVVESASPLNVTDLHPHSSRAQHLVAASAVNTPVAQQEVAARLLLSRRELMERVQATLRPLRWGKYLQIACGIGLIGLGVQCWAPQPHIAHRLVSGLTLHVYGIVMIGAAGHVLTRLRRIDFTQPLLSIQNQLDVVRLAHVQVNPWIGFPWWLLWLPVAVALGGDFVMLPFSLWPSLLIGLVGWAFSWWAYRRWIHPGRDSATRWSAPRVGRSLSHAHATLDEMAQAGIT